MKEIKLDVEHTIEEPTETFGIVGNLSQWQDLMSDKDNSFGFRKTAGPYTNTRLERDVDGEYYLSDVLAGYMTHAAALYRGKSVVAVHKIVKDIIEFKKMIAESDDWYFLYNLNFESIFPRYVTLDEKTFMVDRHDPVLNESRGWFVRYGVLSQENSI